MKKFARYLTALTISFYSFTSQAELIYSPNVVLDTASGYSWSAFTTLEAGLSNGFKPATVAQTAGLFLDYAPPTNDGVLPGYHPIVGGVTSMATNEDGSSFSVSWEGAYFLPDDVPPPSLLSAFGYNVVFGGAGPRADRIRSLVGLVQDGDSWTSVLLRSTRAGDQYGAAWGNEFGMINPSADLFEATYGEYPTYCGADGCETAYGPYYTVCGDNGCGFVAGNPYLDSSGAIKLGGYLMVSSVPELPPAASLIAGLLSLLIFTQAKRKKTLN